MEIYHQKNLQSGYFEETDYLAIFITGSPTPDHCNPVKREKQNGFIISKVLDQMLEKWGLTYIPTAIRERQMILI